MALVTANKKHFLRLIGKKLSESEMEEAINSIGMSFEGYENENMLVDVTANRPDLLSQYGLARAVSCFLGHKKGLRNYKVNKSDYRIKVENTARQWPCVATAVVKGLKLGNEEIKEIIQLQEKMGATMLRNRKKGGMGVYPLEKINFPVRYTSLNPEKIRFRPLESPKPLSAIEILEVHTTGIEYAHIMNGWSRFPVFVDSKNTIMSMPPIINSHDVGKVEVGTRDVFVETTGTDFNTISTALNIMVCALADMGGKIYSTKMNHKESPNLRPFEVEFDLDYINKLLGLNLRLGEVKKLFLRFGYGIRGNKRVLVPAYRADVIHQTDLAEDVAIAYRYDKLKEEIPNVATIGEESRFEVFKRKIANIIAGLGLLEVHTYNLASRINQADKMNAQVKCVELANALNDDYNVLRSWITPSLLQILSENKHNEYPQNIFGFGNVFKYDKKEEAGIKEDVRLSVVLCHFNANFTEAKQILDSLMAALDLKYGIKEAAHGSFISGRVGRISVSEKDIAYIGEIHPEVLENFGLELPVAALEINLSELFNLF